MGRRARVRAPAKKVLPPISPSPAMANRLKIFTLNRED